MHFYFHVAYDYLWILMNDDDICSTDTPNMNNLYHNILSNEQYKY